MKVHRRSVIFSMLAIAAATVSVAAHDSRAQTTKPAQPPAAMLQALDRDVQNLYRAAQSEIVRVTVPVTLTQRDNAQTLDGTLPIKRSQFDIGTGEWKDTSIVSDEVAIKFHLVATKF